MAEGVGLLREPLSFWGFNHARMVLLMGRRARLVYLVQRLSLALVAFWLVVGVGVVHAANDVKVTALNAGYVRAGTNGVGGTVWQTQAQFLANFQRMHDANGATSSVSKYFTKQGPLSPSTIGGLGRKALRGGVYGIATQLALEQMIDGAGWAFNELQNQVVTPGSPAEPLGEVAWCMSVPNGITGCAAAPGQLLGFVTNQVRPAINANLEWPNQQSEPCGVGGSTGEGGRVYWCTRNSDGAQLQSYVEGRTVRPGTTWPPLYQNVGTSTDDVPVSDIQLGEKIRENPGLVNTLLTDPRTGVPVPTPELQQMIDELKEEIRNREGFDPQTPTPTPDVDDDTQTPNEGTDWPGFCSWATVVCDFIDWARSDDEQYEKPEVPWDDAPVEQKQWSSGIGGGSCPSPETLSVSVGGYSANLEFEYTPICTFGGMMKPLVVATAMVLAVFIVGGWRRSANA